MGVGDQRQAPAPLLPRRTPDTHRTGGWGSRMAGVDSTESVASTEIRFPDRPAHSEFLYRLHYFGLNNVSKYNNKLKKTDGQGV